MKKAILYAYIIISTSLLAWWYCWLSNTDNLFGFLFTVAVAVFADVTLYPHNEEEDE
jgi:hypothetical protein